MPPDTETSSQVQTIQMLEAANVPATVDGRQGEALQAALWGLC
jgi:hypothetical protein